MERGRGIARWFGRPIRAGWKALLRLGKLKDTAAVFALVAAGMWALTEFWFPELRATKKAVVPKVTTTASAVRTSGTSPICLVALDTVIQNAGDRSFNVIGYRVTARHLSTTSIDRPTVFGLLPATSATWPPDAASRATLVLDDAQDASPNQVLVLRRDLDFRSMAPNAVSRLEREMLFPLDVAPQGLIRITGRVYMLDNAELERRRAAAGVSSDALPVLCDTATACYPEDRPHQAGIAFTSAAGLTTCRPLETQPTTSSTTASTHALVSVPACDLLSTTASPGASESASKRSRPVTTETAIEVD
jgi:hypothetical protein